MALIGPSGCGKSRAVLRHRWPGYARRRAGACGPRRCNRGTVRAASALTCRRQDLLFPWRSVLDNASLGLEVAGVRRAQARLGRAALLPRSASAGLRTRAPVRPLGRHAAARGSAAHGRPAAPGPPARRAVRCARSLTRTEMQAWLEGVWTSFNRTVLMITHDIREAVFLADRILVFRPRPTSVFCEVAVGLNVARATRRSSPRRRSPQSRPRCSPCGKLGRLSRPGSTETVKPGCRPGRRGPSRFHRPTEEVPRRADPARHPAGLGGRAADRGHRGRSRDATETLRAASTRLRAARARADVNV